MRVFIGGRGAHPPLTGSVDSGAIHAWVFAQGSSTDPLLDIVESGQQSLPATGSPPVGYGCPIEMARAFNGSTQCFAGTANGVDALGLVVANEWSISAWVRPNSGLTAQAYVVAYGGNGSSLATNHILSFAVNSDYTVQTYWETSASAHVVTKSTSTITPAEWTHVGWVYSSGTLKLYLNGVEAESWTGLTGPGCAASGNLQRWVVGAVADTLGSKFKGLIGSVFVWASALAAADMLNAFRRGMGWHYGTTVHACVRVQDGNADPTDPDTFMDVGDMDGLDWLNDIELHDDSDARGLAGTIKLWKERGTASLAKLNDNRLNRTPSSGIGPDDTSYGPATEFLADDRRIQVHVARVPWGISRPASYDAEWQCVFDGVINRVDWSGDVVALDVQDRVVKRLSRAWFEESKAYGDKTSSIAVESVMQTILDDAYANGWVAADPDTGGAVSLYTPTPPGWMIGGYKQSRMSLMDVLSERADQIGWVVRRVWDPDSLSFRLTFYEPERVRTVPVAQLGPGDYYDVTKMEIDPSRIRTTVRVVWWSNEAATPTSGVAVPAGYVRSAGGTDGSAMADGQVTEHWVRWTNSAAEALHGRSFMEIAEAADSNINRVDEADRMALAALRDLMEPRVEQGINAMLFPELEVGDLVRWTANAHHYTTDQDLAVVNVSFTLSTDSSSMSVACRGAPCGSPSRLLQKDPRYGWHPNPTANAAMVTAGLSITRQRNTSWHLANDTRMMRGGRSATLVNSDFQNMIWGPGVPPNAWGMDAGTWGTDATIDTANSLAGRWALKLLTTTAKVSQTIPVQAGQTYQAEMVWSASSSNTGQVVAYWYQADGVTASATASTTVISDTTGTTWLTSRARVTVPSNARWAKLVVQRGSGATAVYVDRVGLTRAMPAFRSYRASTAQALTEGGWTRVVFNTEDYDIGARHSTSTGTFTAGEAGMHRFQAQVTGGSDTASQSLALQAAIYKNGSRWIEGPARVNVSAISYACVATVDSGDILLAAGDTVEVYVFSKEEKAMASSIKAGSGLTWFSGRLLPNE